MIVYEQGRTSWCHFCINTGGRLAIYIDPSPNNSKFSTYDKKKDPTLIINLTKRK